MADPADVLARVLATPAGEAIVDSAEDRARLIELVRAAAPSAPVEVARLREVVAKMTPGPWTSRRVEQAATFDADTDLPVDTIDYYEVDAPDLASLAIVASCEYVDGIDTDEKNAAGIVALRNAADELIAAAEERDRLRAAFREADRSLRTLIDHFDAMDGEEDSATLSADLTSIAETLRAALKEKP